MALTAPRTGPSSCTRATGRLLPKWADGKVVDISKLSRDQVVAMFAARLSPYVFATRFAEGLKHVGDLGDWIEADLKDVEDSDEPYNLPAGCVRRQGAVRQGNEMYVDPTYVKDVSPAQEGMLVVHEAVYWIATEIAKQKNSVHVRELVRNVLRTDTSVGKMVRSIHALGGIAFPFEALAPRTYVARVGSLPPNIRFKVLSAEDGLIGARLYNSSGIALPNPDAELKCQGWRCTVSKATDNTHSWLSAKDAVMEIREETREIVFNPGENEHSYFTADSSPHFP